MTSLRKTTQAVRDEATTKAKMLKINGYLRKMYNVNVALKNNEEKLKTIIEQKADNSKIVARVEFQISEINPKNPDADSIKKNFESILKTAQKDQKDLLEYADKQIEQNAEYKKTKEARLVELESHINKVENGEIKVSIDDVNDFSDNAIATQ